MFTTRALLNQHVSDCREDRARTDKQFSDAKMAMESVERKLGEFEESARKLNDQRHAENTAKFDKLFKVIWALSGAGATVYFLSAHGQKILQLLVPATH